MTDVRIEQIDNIWIKVICEPSIGQELSDFFTFSVPDAKFSPSYKERYWDGKIRLFSTKTNRIYAGLAEYIKEFCKLNDYTYSWNLLNKQSTIAKKEDVPDFEIPLKPHDYQYVAFQHALNKQRAVIVSPTASGKSLIIYMITRWLLKNADKKRGLLIVPTISLVEQMYGDFRDYGWNVEKNCHRIYQGHDKFRDMPLTISTWQSIYDMPKAYFKAFDFVIGDEAHLFKADSLKKIMTSLVNCDYRIGTTGTLDGTKVHKLVLEGLFGPTLQVATTKKLIEDKILADFQIKCLVLKYPEAQCKTMKGCEYKDEIDFLIGHAHRNRFIRNLAESLKGNSLILYTYVDKHGRVLFDLFKKTINGRKIFFVCGKTEAEEREQVRHLTEKENDAIIIASYGTFSTGINIRNLHNVIFASPTKSRIRSLQSIGRGLRLGDNKTNAVLYDIADDLRFKSYVNTTLNHYGERLKMYYGEKFPFKTYNIKLGST
jgi:superfamily II DNA or RNA helicase